MKFSGCPVSFLATCWIWARVQANSGSETCNANSECAALGLADDCCPTNLAGIFLDCCDNKSASCESNPGCRGLDDDCCPAADGTFLYCCFDESESYRRDFSYFASQFFIDSGPSRGEYWVSTGSGKVISSGGKFASRYYEYQRNPDLVYDLLYLRGDIPDAGAYVTGEKKFSMNVRSTAPSCTQIILQFEHIPFPAGETNSAAQIDPSLFQPFPKNRHSRYLANIPSDPNSAFQHVSFEFLDQPDESVPDTDVNAVVIMFAPGKPTEHTFTFNGLASSTKCNSATDGCVEFPTNSCPAIYLTVEGIQEGRRVRSLEEDCSDCADPGCIGVESCAVDSAYGALKEDPGLNQPLQNETATTEDKGGEIIEAYDATGDNTTQETSGTDLGGPPPTTPSSTSSESNLVVAPAMGDTAQESASFLGRSAVAGISTLFLTLTLV